MSGLSKILTNAELSQWLNEMASETRALDSAQAQALREAASRLQAPAVAEVGVKPLEWEPVVRGFWWISDVYRIEASDDGSFSLRASTPARRAFKTLCFGVSFDDAKAAAQADYERRIRSALRTGGSE